MSDKQLTPLCEAAAVTPGNVVRAEADGQSFAVYNLDGTFHVTQDECTHGPGYMSEGFIIDNEIECPFHQGRFDIASGCATLAPATEPLKCWKASVVDGKVCIDLAQHD
jgi:nitrite reductase/ring-hydroxylating ferredoxin subunit